MSESVSLALCLSSATILRCPSLTRFQNVIIVIPTVLEVVFGTALVVVLWNSGHRRHLLLTCESWIYIVLTVLDLLSHVLDSARTNVNVFSAFDIATGVASFLPLFFYTFFLYIYANSELLSNTPSLNKRLSKVGSLLLLLAIPLIIGGNEVASFIGVQRIVVDRQILIGFENRGAFTVNMFFSSLTLALLVLFQGVVFLVSFFRLIIALLNQRKFRTTGRDAAHLVRGVAWLSIGMKFGAIETVIGFAGGGFGLVLTRRIFRFVARACLCFGVIKGVDEISDFRAVQKEMLENGRAKYFKGDSRGIRDLISNPRLSTFKQLSPTAREFYSVPRGYAFNDHTFDYNKEEKVPFDSPKHSPATSNLHSLHELQGIATFASLKEKEEESEKERKNAEQRVTIGYRDGRPTLHLRLSSGPKFPSPTHILDRVKSRVSNGSSGGFEKVSIPETEKRSVYSWRTSVMSFKTNGSPDPITLLRPNVSSLLMMHTRSMSEDLKPPSINQNRESITASLASRVEIVAAPQRTVSVSKHRPKLFSVSNTLKLMTASTSPITEDGPKPMFANEFSESPATYRSSTGSMLFQRTEPQVPPPVAQAPSSAPRANPHVSVMSSYTATDDDLTPTANQFRIVSDYSTFSARRESAAVTLQEVRTLTKKFPGPPITYNGRPLMGGLGQTIYEGESSAPTTPAYPDNDNARDTARESMDSMEYRPLPPPPARTRGSAGRQLMDSLRWKAVQRASFIQSPLRNETQYDVDLEAARSSVDQDDADDPVRSRFDRESEFYDDNASSRYSRVGTVATMDSDDVRPLPSVFGDGVTRDDHGKTPKGGASSKSLKSMASKTSSKMSKTSKTSSIISVGTAFGARPPALGEDSLKRASALAGMPAMPPMKKATGPYPLLTASLAPRAPTTTNAPSHPVSVPVSPEDQRASARISSYTTLSSNVMMGATDHLKPEAALEDPYSELAVRTGGSTDLRQSRGLSLAMAKSNWPTKTMGAGGLPTPPMESATAATPRASLAVPSTERARRPPSKIIWITESGDSKEGATGVQEQEKQEGAVEQQPQEDVVAPSSDGASAWRVGKLGEPLRSTSVADEEHRRQQSIDAAAQVLSNSIPWLKNPEIEEEERELAKALSASSLKVGGRNQISISRIKSVGNVKQRTTPSPTRHPGATRKSLHIKPIMIPPQGSHMGRMEIVTGESTPQSASAVSPGRTSTSVRRDSDVFGVDDHAATLTARLTTRQDD